MSKLKNYYSYDYEELNRNYTIKIGEKTTPIPTYTLNQAEIAEIDEALDKAGKRIEAIRSRYFIGIVGEKLMEKFLGLKFCDMTFDKPSTYYMHSDVPVLGIGIKTVLSAKGKTEGIWMNALDFTNEQFIAYVSYNHAKMCWVLDKVEKAYSYERLSDNIDCTGRVLVVPKDCEILYEAPAPKRLF